MDTHRMSTGRRAPVFELWEFRASRLSGGGNRPNPSFSRGNPVIQAWLAPPARFAPVYSPKANAAGLGTDGVTLRTFPLLPLRSRPGNCRRLGSPGIGLHRGGVSVLNRSGWSRGCPPGPRRALPHPGRVRGLERLSRKRRSSGSPGPSRGVATPRTRSNVGRTARSATLPSRRPRSLPTRPAG